MQKNILVLSLIMAISLLFTSCNSTRESYSTYQCPMKCEGSKTYDKEGTCPVCNMDLEGVKSNTKK
jgi:protein SCO1/2